MIFQVRTYALFGVILTLTTFEIPRTGSIRLCGRRLSDLLNFICERQGGFHAPRVRKDATSKPPSKRAVMDIFWPVRRRSDPGFTDLTTAGTIDGSDETFSYQSGIVDECCRKPCTLATMVSYCANSQQIGDIDLEEVLPEESESLPIISAEDLAAYQIQQSPSESDFADSSGYPLSSQVAYSSRPNLGLSSRNRPVFIVLTQVQEDEERTLGDQKF